MEVSDRVTHMFAGLWRDALQDFQLSLEAPHIYMAEMAYKQIVRSVPNCLRSREHRVWYWLDLSVKLC